jgi:uncharacterized protein YecE (DUF72 family)
MQDSGRKVGCCGFPSASGKYFRTFPVVEIQQTFYHPPRPATADRWRRQAPPEFEFTLKAWQLITHEASSPTYKKLKFEIDDSDKRMVGSFRFTGIVRKAWDTTLEIARILNTGKVVFQCPASFRPSKRNMDRMRMFFENIDRRGITCIWEPRGDWTEHQVAGLCEDLDLVHCVDPMVSRSATGGLRYWRLHGIGGYHYTYSDEELGKLASLSSGRSEYYILFNNTTMVADAARFLEMIK